MIEVTDLRKTYGDIVAVDGISFVARGGRIFGLLGPNGAGKTTTIGCICGLMLPTAGTIRLLGKDVVHEGTAARQSLGIVPQEIALYEDLSAEENLAYWGGAQGMRGTALKDRTREVLDETGLLDRGKEPVKRFSGGMKRRLNFACGIVHRPKVLLLDEPTVGVDPQSRLRLLELVREQAKAGTCVLYTTHYMEEAQSLCNDLAIIDHGKIIAHGTLDELRGMSGERDLVRLTGKFDVQDVRAALQPLHDLEIVTADAEHVALAWPGATAKLPELFAAMAHAGAEIHGTTLTQPSLESLFIRLTGKELRE
jgi:ABC-2 type transport system ATP-binding protein